MLKTCIQIITSFIFSIFISGSLVAAPFGIEMGSDPQDLNSQPGPQFGVYTIEQAPISHPSFESYAVIATNTHGVCKVIGVGKTINSNNFGTQLKSEFSDLRAALENKYGKPETNLDQLFPGSIWDDPENFMMGLLKKERLLWSVWSAGENGSSFPDEIVAISLRAQALNSSSGYVNLTFEFENFEACLLEIKNKENEAF